MSGRRPSRIRELGASVGVAAMALSGSLAVPTSLRGVLAITSALQIALLLPVMRAALRGTQRTNAASERRTDRLRVAGVQVARVETSRLEDELDDSEAHEEIAVTPDARQRS